MSYHRYFIKRGSLFFGMMVIVLLFALPGWRVKAAGIMAGVSITPPTAEQSGNPGVTVTYSLSVYNTGSTSDTYDVTWSGNAWITSAPLTIGPIGSHVSQTLNVDVTIPDDAAGGDDDVATVTVTSQVNPVKSDSSILTTTANNIYGVTVEPPTDAQSGDPGAVLHYSLTVTNTGNITDTFTVVVSGNAWPTNAPTPVGPLARNGSQVLDVSVTIPDSAGGGAVDTATITFTSQANGATADASTLTTTANNIYGVTVEPPTDAQSGDPGAVLHYSLTVTNTGNITDTFTVVVSGNAWSTNAPATIGPINGHTSQALSVDVTIPAGAPAGVTDTATLTVTSQADGSKSDSSTLTTTTNNVYRVEIVPADDSKTGMPGAIASYILNVTNTGNVVDTYNVAVSGNAWFTSLPSSVGPLSVNASQALNVFVTIPPTTDGGTTDTAAVTVTSQGNDAQSDTSILTTTATRTFGVTVGPATDAGNGDPGGVVHYALTVTNTGNAADTFSVAITGNTWTTVAPPTIGPIARGASQVLNVDVTVPASAAGGTSDTATVTVTSQANGATWDISTLTTTANTLWGVSVEPPTDSKSGNPGAVVNYSLTVTNDGNTSDTYNVTVSGNAWTTNAQAIIGPIGGHSNQTLPVTVVIPISALGGASDAATIKVTSINNPARWDSSTLTTTANHVYGVTVEPSTATKEDYPGATVEYTLTVTNTGNTDDTYNVSVSGASWTTHAPATLDPVAHGASQTMKVTVDIPATATAGDDDVATITVTSQANGSKSDNAVLTTTANKLKIFLPMVMNGYTSPGIVLSPAAGLETNENGKQVILRVSLRSKPTGTVSVAITSSDTSEAKVSPASLTFTSTDWAPQTVTITGQDDMVKDGDQPYTIQATASGGGEYNGLQATASGLNLDDDVFVDNFGGAVDNWEHFGDPGAGWVLVNGEYQLIHTLANYNTRAVAPFSASNILQNYFVQAQGRIVPGSYQGSRYGVMFDWLDMNHLYRFMVSPSEQRWYLQYFQNGWKPVGPGEGPSTHIKTGQETNLLRVERRGDSVEIFIWDSRWYSLWQGWDDTYSNGQVGLIMLVAGDPGSTVGRVSFDNFVIGRLFPTLFNLSLVP